MEKDQLSQELERFVYEKIQKSETPEIYMRFWASLSFPTKIWAHILYIDPIPGIKETYDEFKTIVETADVEYRRLLSERNNIQK